MGLAVLATVWLISFVRSDFFHRKNLGLGVGACGTDRQFTVTYILSHRGQYALDRLPGGTAIRNRGKSHAEGERAHVPL